MRMRPSLLLVSLAAWVLSGVVDAQRVDTLGPEVRKYVRVGTPRTVLQHVNVIDGTWVQEWPGDSAVNESWFWHQNGLRTLQCQWGWYLTDLDNTAWRTW